MKKTLLLLLIALLLLSACSQGSYKKGFSSASRMPDRPDPKTDYQDEALRLAAGYGDVVLIETQPFKGDAEVKRVTDLFNKAKKHGLGTALGVKFFDERNYGFLPATERFAKTEAQADLKKYFADLAELKPDYLVVGLDIYRYKFVQPFDYKAFTNFYNQTLYPDLKKISPQSKIAPAFDYELLIDQQDFTAFETFKDTSDVMGIVTFPLHYPYLVSPESIRSNYYSQINPYLQGKKLAIFSMGYPSDNGSDPVRGDFYSSEDAQMRFMQRFPELIKDVPLELIIWRFLFDYPSLQNTEFSNYFRTTGLLDEFRQPKQAFELWKNL